MNLPRILLFFETLRHYNVLAPQIGEDQHPLHPGVEGGMEHLKEDDAQRVYVHLLVVYDFGTGLQEFRSHV